MVFLIGLAATAVFAGCVAYVSEKSSARPERVAIRLFNLFFKELFYEVIFGTRPDPWTINWAKVSYSRYKFSDSLKQQLKALADLDNARCQDYSRGMTHDIWKLPCGINDLTYTPIPHMLRQGWRWRVYDPVRWRYEYFSWYQHTVLSRVKMNRELEQRWKYEVYMQQPRRGGLYQKCFGESLPPNNYPHKKVILKYIPNYDVWFGPSHNNPRYWRVEPRGIQYIWTRRFLDILNEDDPYVPKVWWTIEGFGHGGIHPYDYDEDGNLKQRTFYPVDHESEGEYMGEQTR